MEILSIGNSFSQDAQRFLHSIAAADGTELNCANLYVGGCSLEQHAAFLESGEPVYDWEWDGAPTGQKISLQAAVESRPWDIITLQQASHLSGVPDSYFPYLEQLTAYLRQVQPQAALYLHETWAYEPDSTHPAFVRYGSDVPAAAGRLCRRCPAAGAAADPRGRRDPNAAAGAAGLWPFPGRALYHPRRVPSFLGLRALRRRADLVSDADRTGCGYTVVYTRRSSGAGRSRPRRPAGDLPNGGANG